MPERDQEIIFETVDSILSLEVDIVVPEEPIDEPITEPETPVEGEYRYSIEELETLKHIDSLLIELSISHLTGDEETTDKLVSEIQ